MINVTYDSKSHILILTADNEGRADLKSAYSSQGYYGAETTVSEALHEAYEFIEPEDIGALTSAPILVDCDHLAYPDNGDRVVIEGARIFWFPNYAVTDPWEVLKNTGRVVFTEATPYPD